MAPIRLRLIIYLPPRICMATEPEALEMPGSDESMSIINDCRKNWKAGLKPGSRVWDMSRERRRFGAIHASGQAGISPTIQPDAETRWLQRNKRGPGGPRTSRPGGRRYSVGAHGMNRLLHDDSVFAFRNRRLSGLNGTAFCAPHCPLRYAFRGDSPHLSPAIHPTLSVFRDFFPELRL